MRFLLGKLLGMSHPDALRSKGEQREPERPHSREASVRCARHRGQDHFLESRGKIWVELPWRREIALNDPMDELVERRLFHGAAPRYALVEDHADGILIRS